MKRETTVRGSTAQKIVIKRRWFKAWKDMPQTSIQGWIEGIMANIKKIIALEGGNEYKEGRDVRRAYRKDRKVGYLPKHAHYRENHEDATMSIGAILNNEGQPSGNEDDWEDDEPEDDD